MLGRQTFLFDIYISGYIAKCWLTLLVCVLTVSCSDGKPKLQSYNAVLDSVEAYGTVGVVTYSNMYLGVYYKAPSSTRLSSGGLVKMYPGVEIDGDADYLKNLEQSTLFTVSMPMDTLLARCLYQYQYPASTQAEVDRFLAEVKHDHISSYDAMGLSISSQKKKVMKLSGVEIPYLEYELTDGRVTWGFRCHAFISKYGIFSLDIYGPKHVVDEHSREIIEGMRVGKLVYERGRSR